MRTLPLLSAVCHRPSGVVDAAVGAAVCCTGGAVFATGAGATGAALVVVAGARTSLVAGRPDRRSRVSLSDTEAGGGTLLATGGGGGGGLFATGSGAGAGGCACAGCCTLAGAVATSSSSSSDFLPLRLMFFRLIAAPLLVTVRQDSELQLRDASMWIFCPSISKEIPLPARALVDAISKAAAAVR